MVGLDRVPRLALLVGEFIPRHRQRAHFGPRPALVGYGEFLARTTFVLLTGNKSYVWRVTGASDRSGLPPEV